MASLPTCPDSGPWRLPAPNLSSELLCSLILSRFYQDLTLQFQLVFILKRILTSSRVPSRRIQGRILLHLFPLLLPFLRITILTRI